MNLPITIVGANENKKFFEAHRDLLEYDKLTVIDTNITEEEKLRIMQEHTIFVHPSMLEYGCPNLSVLEAASCCLPIVATNKGAEPLIGMSKLEELTTEAVVKGIKDVISWYSIAVSDMKKVREQYNWIWVVKHLEKMYEASLQTKHYNSNIIREKYINTYNKEK